jgi:precorrin-2 dehydrogenase/sirohydrochlorin ferrochelatase
VKLSRPGERRVLPIILKDGAVGLAGAGEALGRRRKFLADSGQRVERVEPGLPPPDLVGLAALFVAGLPRSQSQQLASAARRAGVLVNVEDQPDLCDFYVPAVVRRGDLLIAISTSGKSPGLAKLIRQWIERKVTPAWAGRLAEASTSRAKWRAGGSSLADVAQKTADLVQEKGWLA